MAELIIYRLGGSRVFPEVGKVRVASERRSAEEARQQLSRVGSAMGCSNEEHGVKSACYTVVYRITLSKDVCLLYDQTSHRMANHDEWKLQPRN